MLLKWFNCAVVFVLALGVISCSSSDDKAPIAGERFSVLQLQKALEPDDTMDGEDFMMPEGWTNEFWPQAGGYPDHAMRHLSLNSGELTEVWEADIGSGSDKRSRLNSEPIIVGNRVFAMDIDGDVSAFDASNGDRLWRVNIQPEDEENAALTGGIGFGDNLLYVTDAYGYVLALKPDTGEKVWDFNTVVPARAAPTIVDGRVFVVTMNNALYALDAKTGSELWKQTGVNETVGMLGTPSPAASGQMLVVVYSSGEVSGLRVENGQTAWSDNLSSVQVSYGGLSNMSDISGSPVIDGGVVFVASTGGRIVAIDSRSGSRLWQREIGVLSMPWVVGNFLFVVSTQNELVALTKESGRIRWVTKLPSFEDEEDKEDAITWTRPIFAGGRLVLAGSNEQVLEINPADGSVLREWDADDAVRLPPVVANDTLFLLSENGLLKAYK